MDRSLYSVFGTYGTLGLLASYGVDPAAVLSPAGLDVARHVEGECVLDLTKHSLRQQCVTDPRRPTVVPVAGERSEPERCRSRQPSRAHGSSVPVLFSHSALDDIIPYAESKTLAQDWCGLGGNVQLRTNVATDHLTVAVTFSADALPWWGGTLRKPEAGVHVLRPHPVALTHRAPRHDAG